MKYIKFTCFFIIISLLNLSCKKLLQVEVPKDSLVQSSIFSSDDLATSAITGIYYSMSSFGYASGGSESLTSVCGLSSDELINYNSNLSQFYENQLIPTNSTIGNSLWLVPYQNIYAANAVLEGLASPNTVSPPTKSQLQGEALFIRAFIYFYLVNLYGPIPLHLSTDNRINQVATKASIDDVYRQIIIDLKTSETLISDKYITTERVRPNLSSVYALLARTYLYLKDYANAIKYSKLVIDKIDTYGLVVPDAVFLKNSLETIWQIMPPAGSNAKEGELFILTATPVNVSLNPILAVSGFEINDKRKISWVKSITNSTGTYYYPNKYKVKSATSPSEYSMVLRLAEQYLIRAEAKAHLNDIDGAISDLDVIRNRAGIALIKNTNPSINLQNLLTTIQNERKVELFSEWGHRWLDLKRTNMAISVLKPIKPKWQETAVYYPIPQTEINRNTNITQNQGY